MTHDPGGKVKLQLPQGWTSSVLFQGKTQQYRSILHYGWGPGETILWVMMNPSTATDECLDPTLAKCGRITKKLGYGGFSVCNVCDYRLTDSKLLHKQEQPCSGGNKHIMAHACLHSAITIVGWGNLHRSIKQHASDAVLALRTAGKDLYCLAINKDGSPKHPLYCKESSPLLIY